MLGAARLALCLILPAAALAGCGDIAPSGNAADADTNALADMSSDGSANGSDRVHSGSNAAAGAIVPGQEVMLEGNGLGVAVRGLPVGRHYEFGRPKAELIAMATSLRGPPTGSGRNEECGEGPIEHVDFGNLRLNFQQDRFVGWDASPGDPPVRDELGFGIGSPISDLSLDDDERVRIETSTLGIEFEAGGFHGLLDSRRSDATVTDLWAGMVCAFR